MPLMPKRVKHRKLHRGSMKGQTKTNGSLCFGEYGLKAVTRGWVKNTQIEACRVTINRHMKRKGKLWIRVFPDKPVTKKPIEVRMGQGKGNTDHWVAVVKPGTIIFEIDGVTERTARESLRLAAAKLGITTRLMARHGYGA